MKIELDNRLIDLSKLSYEELLEMKLDLEARLDIAKTAIATAKRSVFQKGIYADSTRFTKVETLARAMGRKIQAVQGQISLLRRREKQSSEVRFDRQFVEIARKVLSPDTWKFIVDAIERE